MKSLPSPWYFMKGRLLPVLSFTFALLLACWPTIG